MKNQYKLLFFSCREKLLAQRFIFSFAPISNVGILIDILNSLWIGSAWYFHIRNEKNRLEWYPKWPNKLLTFHRQDNNIQNKIPTVKIYCQNMQKKRFLSYQVQDERKNFKFKISFPFRIDYLHENKFPRAWKSIEVFYWNFIHVFCLR